MIPDEQAALVAYTGTIRIGAKAEQASGALKGLVRAFAQAAECESRTFYAHPDLMDMDANDAHWRGLS